MALVLQKKGCPGSPFSDMTGAHSTSTWNQLQICIPRTMAELGSRLR